MRKISCKDCEYYSIKERLSNENKIIRKDYCRHFRKELSSLKPCRRFVEKEEPQTLIEQIAVLPVALFLSGIIAFIIFMIANGWAIPTIIILMVTLICLAFCLWFFFYLL